MQNDIKDLVKRFADGDPQAFAEIVRRYKTEIYRLAFRMLGNHLDADDATQEAFVRVFERQREIREVKHFPGFLKRIAVNYCIDMIRRKQKKFISVDDMSTSSDVQAELAELTAGPDENLENTEITSEIKGALEKLPPKQRMAISLHIEGYSKAEIADIMSCPQATVRSNLHIARKKLRKWLAKLI